MSIADTSTFDQRDGEPVDLEPQPYYDDPEHDPEYQAECVLVALRRELVQAKLVLTAQIMDLQAEVSTLRLNALNTAGELDRLVLRLLSAPAQNPYDPRS